MLGAYYSKAFNSRELFDKLNISNSYEKFIERIISLLKNDILNTFPDIKKIIDDYEIFDILSLTKEKIFIIHVQLYVH